MIYKPYRAKLINRNREVGERERPEVLESFESIPSSRSEKISRFSRRVGSETGKATKKVGRSFLDIGKTIRTDYKKAYPRKKTYKYVAVKRKGKRKIVRKAIPRKGYYHSKPDTFMKVPGWFR